MWCGTNKVMYGEGISEAPLLAFLYISSSHRDIDEKTECNIPFAIYLKCTQSLIIKVRGNNNICLHHQQLLRCVVIMYINNI